MSTSCAAAIRPTSGTTRSISSATATGGRPPTADSPPTSSTVGARAATQLGGAGGLRSGWSPASENESGDALTTPISSGGPPSSSSRRPARSLT